MRHQSSLTQIDGSQKFSPPPETYSLLQSLFTSLEDGDQSEVRRALLSKQQVQEPYSFDDIKALSFFRALGQRISDTQPEWINIYLQSLEFSQIQAFNLLSEKMPVIGTATVLANGILSNSLANIDEPTLLDIGIGTARQELDLFACLKSKNQLPKKMKVIGIEPALPSLMLAQKNMEWAAHQYGIQIEFIPLHASLEQLTKQHWQDLRKESGRLIINEAFSLHHVSYTKTESATQMKDILLSKLRETDPFQFVLTEPDSDHEVGNLQQRFENAWRHFSAIHKLIGSLPIALEEKHTLWEFFFAREVVDILGANEKERTERHESSQMWTKRLEKAGFQVKLPNLGFEADIAHPLLSLAMEPQGLTIRYETTPLVSILVAS